MMLPRDEFPLIRYPLGDEAIGKIVDQSVASVILVTRVFGPNEDEICNLGQA